MKVNVGGRKKFFKTIILNRNMKVSGEGLSELGAGIKELRSLTNLSLNFEFINLNYFFAFAKPFCEASAAYWSELYEVTCCFLFCCVAHPKRLGVLF
jgi:hypothetical protein